MILRTGAMADQVDGYASAQVEAADAVRLAGFDGLLAVRTDRWYS
jgi:hypothetical protein